MSDSISFRSLLLAGAAFCAAVGPLQAQVRPLHTRDLTRLGQPQVTEYLKRSDVIFIPVGAVEANGNAPSNRDYITPLAWAMAAAEANNALFMPGLMWSYPGTTMVASGTVSITPTQGIDFLRATAESLLRQGFRRQIYFSASHGPAPLTLGLLAREFYDKYRVPIMYVDIGEKIGALGVPAEARNRVAYGVRSMTGTLIDMPLRGDYGPAAAPATPAPPNTGLQKLTSLGFAGSLRLGSWINDDMAHGGGGGGNLPATAAEREAWGKEGEAQIRALIKMIKFPEVIAALKEHDEYTNKVLGPKFDHILPPAAR